MLESLDIRDFTCPAPQAANEKILLGHGSGGQLSADLVQNLIVRGLGTSSPLALEDQATLDWHSRCAAGERLAFTTDSFVVHPLFFPGGDIGTLAVNGTINDLAVGGARPLFLSVAFILEEGFPLSDLRRIVASMRTACGSAGVEIVTGDTKVVDRGRGDHIYITTTGIGTVPTDRQLSIAAARPGDKILVSGTIGDHGIAIMSVREGLEFETVLSSDCAALNGLTEAMLKSCRSIRAMRDPTRGGLASTLNELATASRVGVAINESSIPVRPEVRGACEMLGLEVLHVACEGKLIAVVAPDEAEMLLTVMRQHPLGANAAIIGEVTAQHPGLVVQRTLIGGQRVVAMLSGEQLPRIC